MGQGAQGLQGPEGPRGPAGPRGPEGPPGKDGGGGGSGTINNDMIVEAVSDNVLWCGDGNICKLPDKPIANSASKPVRFNNSVNITGEVNVPGKDGIRIGEWRIKIGEGGTLIFINSAGETVTEIKSDGDIWSKKLGRSGDKLGAWLSEGIQTQQVAIPTDDKNTAWKITKSQSNLILDRQGAGQRFGLAPDGKIDLHNNWSMIPAEWFIDFKLNNDSKVSFGNSGDIWSKHNGVTIDGNTHNLGGWLSNGFMSKNIVIASAGGNMTLRDDGHGSLLFDKQGKGVRAKIEKEWDVGTVVGNNAFYQIKEAGNQNHCIDSGGHLQQCDWNNARRRFQLQKAPHGWV